MKLVDLLKLFKWPDYRLCVFADTSNGTDDCVWSGGIGEFLKQNPVNESPRSRAKDNHLGNYRVVKAEANPNSTRRNEK